MFASVEYSTDAAILGEVFLPEEPTLARQHAEWLKSLKFTDRQQARMVELADKGNRGELTPAELEEMDRFCRIGMMLNLLQAKAELSLRESTAAA
jgi:hypothetical protein